MDDVKVKIPDLNAYDIINECKNQIKKDPILINF